ncbi:MAG: hypothetical protein HQM07_01660 [Zetaproteobacteria bacterium]|nr:hypothetical protein [Zetaproteobacteria bacterium]
MSDDFFRPLPPPPVKSSVFDDDQSWMELAQSLDDVTTYSFPEFDAEEEVYQPHTPALPEIDPNDPHASGILSEEYLRQLESEAQDRGYMAGEQAGMKIAQERGMQTIQEMEILIAAMRRDFDTMQQQWATVTIDIAEAMARKALGTLTDVQHLAMISQVKSSAMISENSHWVLAVPSEALQHIERLMENVVDPFKLIVADSKLHAGSVCLKAKEGDVLLNPCEEIHRAAMALKQSIAAWKPSLDIDDEASERDASTLV